MPSSTSASPPLLELHNVSVCRNGREVLHALDLRITDGEHVAILGPNGSGKSTLIQLLTRDLYPRFDGRSSMLLFGRESWEIGELRSLLGIVTNDVAPFCERGITGGEAVLSGFFSSVGVAWHHTVEPAMREKTDAALASLEITHLAERPMDEMSSGEARRVMIARALVHSPRALVFDEPSNSLDVSAQLELRRTMSRLAQGDSEKPGLALLLITHHLPDIVPEIGRVILLRAGSIVGDGSTAEMLTEERLSSLFGCAVRITVENGHYHLAADSRVYNARNTTRGR